MTAWRPGMLAECVRDDWTGTVAEIPGDVKLGDVVRVTRVRDVPDFPGDLALHFAVGDQLLGYWADCFRPILENEDDAELIARIRVSAPRRVPA